VTTPHLATISVRGEASRLVDPDFVIIETAVSAIADSISAATELVSASVRRLLDVLAELGGAALTTATAKNALTWSTSSLSTGIDYVEKSGRRHPRASVHLTLAVRSFDLLPPVSAALTSDDHVSLHWVSWRVDEDNPAWRDVRAAAISAALRKGADYADALGGRVAAVHHVADQGLLAGDAPDGSPRRMALSARAAAATAESDVPSLDPVPQEIRAVIEARLHATTGDLDALTAS
jgi:uncharacterized protein YggE